MQGLLLILYILVVSGLIAVVGDRVGYRIGKKRLSWFNLRPRHTAVLVAVLTGITISALTLATLLLLNRSLTEALFNYQQIINTNQLFLDNLNQQVESQQATLDSLKSNLDQQIIQRSDAQERLAELLDQRDEANTKLVAATQDLEVTRAQLENAEAKLEILESDATTVQRQVLSLTQQLEDLEAAQQALKLDRDQLERSLTAAQTTLSALNEQKAALETDIEVLQQAAHNFRRGELNILAGEILATDVVNASILSAPERQTRLDQILAVAEQRAIDLGARPTPPLQNAIQIRRDDVEAILNQLAQPQEWVVRIISSSNRLRGESVPVVVAVNANELIFAEGEILATSLVQPDDQQAELEQHLIELLSLANIRSQEAGLLANPLTGSVGELSQVQLLETLEHLKASTSPVEVSVVTQRNIYTSGPLQVSLSVNKPAASSRP